MITELERCEQQAKELPLQERAILISRLIKGMDELDEQELERLWLAESSRRFEEYKSGKIQAKSGEDVFRDVRTKLEAL